MDKLWTALGNLERASQLRSVWGAHFLLSLSFSSISYIAHIFTSVIDSERKLTTIFFLLVKQNQICLGYFIVEYTSLCLWFSRLYFYYASW